MYNKVYPNRMKHGPGPAERGSLPAAPPRRVSRRTVLQTGLGLAVASCGLGTFFGLERGFTHAAQATDNVVLQWNNAALQAIRDVNPGPTVASRAMAIMHTCMYDAWAPYDSLAVPTRPTG